MTKGSDEGSPIIRLSGQRHSNQVGICDHCHTSFNRQVEHWGSERLRPLVSGSAEHSRFELAEFERLAAWCFKQAVVLDLTEPPAIIPEEHRRWFGKRFIPPYSAAIWVGTLLQSAGWFHYRDQMTFAPGSISVYAFTARAGEFFFQVLGPRGGVSADLTRTAEDVVQIWPPEQAFTGPWIPGSGHRMTNKRFERAARLGFNRRTRRAH